MTFSIVQMYLTIQYIVSCILFQNNIINHPCSPVFTVSKCNLYVYNHSDILIRTYIVLLGPIMLVAVEKAIYEATSVKQSYY